MAGEGFDNPAHPHRHGIIARHGGPRWRLGVSETPVVLPKWGLTMLDATLVEWLKGEGERVEVDDPICLVETDKVDAEVTAPVAGVLGPLLVQKDDVVQVGSTLTTIRED
jgi:pyruvate/2-oxoglutarate dehydrogenase complex dihydrolipoamide acyltransferase (E2) component